ncbi:SUN domain-containing protein 1 isoform X2 [Echinops telfairi]|uniref:SUN domain-containing protein 1 isoform X2 n=1 Tax=Echinops telfairi TaxID=9371 RepID=A0AC55CR65_ECHTE|nr:SUN domain-containing protein 1 isoform X2 [Echinops telfairi]
MNMDFSRLHTYSPPQCVPENTGYTYALSSSYSSEALDFEVAHKLDPVFDSPRMSRRSLRLVTPAFTSGDGPDAKGPAGVRSSASSKDRMSRTARPGKSSSRLAFSVDCAPGKVATVAVSQSGCRSLQDNMALRPPVLDASLIREQTKVDHFWGLDDDDGDLRGASKATAAGHGNGDLAAAADAAPINGYTCSSCSLLAARKEALATHTSRVYSRDRSQTLAGQGGWTGEDSHLGVEGKPPCDDAWVEKEHLETHTSSHRQQHSWLPGAERLSVSSAGRALARVLHRSVAAVGWFVSLGVWSALWLAITAPGKAASGALWWLSIGWYQLVTLTSWLNVFFLTRCLRNLCKFLVLLLPLIFLLGAGLEFWGQGNLLSLLPILNWTHLHAALRTHGPTNVLPPDTAHQHRPLEGGGEAALGWQQLHDMEQQVASLSGRCQVHEEKLRELVLLLRALQARADQADGDRDSMLSLVRQLAEQRREGTPRPETDMAASHQEHGLRISNLEAEIRRLTERSQAIQVELEQAMRRTASGAADEQQLLSTVRQLEQQLEQLRGEVAGWQALRSSCEDAAMTREEVDTQVRETIRLLFSDDPATIAGLQHRLSSQFVSKDELQWRLQDLELQLLKNITYHISVTQQAPSPAAVVATVQEAGVPGITEAQARAIVNNALKLYSQDKTGLVDFALESGGGSVLSTRCSETYETKTALLSLFGVPLWYFSQSPRVVIQPDIHPGNCWAFRGAQGYLVVRLSMAVHPTAFTLEHIPKALSPTGNITSAPKDFAVYGLESEYQEEGLLLGQFTYDQDGESLQMFHVLKRPERAFQIVELRILSNWGHPEYTCLYRFRVHGEPIK